MRKIAAFIALIAAGVAAYWWFDKDDSQPQTLVVYCAQDASYAEEVFQEFEKRTGIKVIPKYDGESTKSLGLINLLIKEANQPQCDVFWNNELLGMCDLHEQGLLHPHRSPNFARIPEQYKDPAGHWAGFAARLRVYIVNTEKMKPDPDAIEKILENNDEDLTRVAMAHPLFGTTLTQYTLLQKVMGSEKLRMWHRMLRKRGLRDVKGNAEVKDRVASGACDFGFTDNDDFFVAKKAGNPVAMLPVRVDKKTICIPNTVGIIYGTQRLAAAEKLVDFLLSADVELMLANSDSRQIPLGPIDESNLPAEILPMMEWAAQGADLRDLLPSRQAVIIWLKSEYLQ